jgi:hypothetical protein
MKGRGASTRLTFYSWGNDGRLWGKDGFDLILHG